VNINSGLKSPVKQKKESQNKNNPVWQDTRVHDTYLRSGASRSIRGPGFKSKQAVILCFAGDGTYGGTRVVERRIISLIDPTHTIKTHDQRTRFKVTIPRSGNDLES
jgi:hypothetical protein